MDLPFADKLVGIKRNGDTISCQCPICFLEDGGDSGKSHLSIHKNLRFHCYKYPNDRAHNKKIYDYLYDQVSSGEIDNWREGLGVQEDKIEIVKVYEESILARLIPSHEYWVGRGVKEDVLARLGSGLAAEEKSKLSSRYIFPCRNNKGQLIGFAGRDCSYNSLAKRWKILGPKKHFIFPPVSLSLSAIRQQGAVILVEGIGCSLFLANHSLWNGICLFGIKPSSSIVSLLIAQNPAKIFIATNNEASGIGNQAAESIKETLCNYFKAEDLIIHLPLAKDFLDMTKEQMTEWISEYKRIKDNLIF